MSLKTKAMPLSFTLLILFFGCATTQPKIAVDSTSALPAGEVTFKGNPLTLIGEPISVGQPLPSVELTDAETTGDVDLSQEKGSVLLLSIVPSLDTPLCEEQTHYLGEQGKWLPALVKLPAYKAGLPGKEMDSIWIVPLHPAYKAGLAGHAPVKRQPSWLSSGPKLTHWSRLRQDNLKRIGPLPLKDECRLRDLASG